VIERARDDVRLCTERADDLAALGLVVEPFGDDALLVRAVPAHLRECVDEPNIAELVASILPWLRVGTSSREDALRVLASTSGSDPAPRFARRWLRELLAEGADLATIPGIRCFTPDDLRAHS
jgi:DNA mismatch repair protein MutL